MKFASTPNRPPWLLVPVGDRRGHLARIPGGLGLCDHLARDRGRTAGATPGRSTPYTIHKVVFTEVDTGHGHHIEFITEHFNTPECSRLAVRRWPTWLAVPVGDRRGHLARIPGGRWSPRRRSLPTTTSHCWELACNAMLDNGLDADRGRTDDTSIQKHSRSQCPLLTDGHSRSQLLQPLRPAPPSGQVAPRGHRPSAGPRCSSRRGITPQGQAWS